MEQGKLVGNRSTILPFFYSCIWYIKKLKLCLKCWINLGTSFTFSMTHFKGWPLVISKWGSRLNTWLHRGNEPSSDSNFDSNFSEILPSLCVHLMHFVLLLQVEKLRSFYLCVLILGVFCAFSAEIALLFYTPLYGWRSFLFTTVYYIYCILIVLALVSVFELSPPHSTGMMERERANL